MSYPNNPVVQMHNQAHSILAKELPEVYALGTAHPDYQEELKRIIDRLARDRALAR